MGNPTQRWVNAGVWTLAGLLLAIMLGTGAAKPTLARAQAGGLHNSRYASDCSGPRFCMPVNTSATVPESSGSTWNQASGPTPVPGAPPMCPPAPPPSNPLPPVAPVYVCYAPGWDLIQARAAFHSSVAGWIWDPNTGQYQPLNPSMALKDYQGAWAYFASPTLVQIGVTAPVGSDATVPVTAGQWQQIADPFSFNGVLVCGVSSVYVYDPASGTYSQTTHLVPGQGAWVFSSADGTLTLVPAPLPAAGCPPS